MARTQFGVSSLSVRGEEGMIVSGSRDGTIRKWEASGQEIGTRIAAEDREVWF